MINNRPLLLLVGTGAMLGLNFPIGKLALANGVHPAMWAAVISGGAGLAMWVITLIFEATKTEPKATLKFSLVSGFISYVMPNFLTFTVIPEIGSGLASIMFALSPVVTALLSILFRVRPPNLFGLIGIALGLVGALVIIVGRGGEIGANSLTWTLAALLIPLFLGLGNVYRTLAWPTGASPRKLASITNLAAVPMLLAIVLGSTGEIDLTPLSKMPFVVLGQIAISTFMFLLFFRLQQIGGPTYLSQIGYVAAAVGVGIGMLIFGETYPLAVWLGISLIATGLAISTIDQIYQRE